MNLPDYEALLNRFYTRLLRPGQTAVDVGAHIGTHALPIAQALGPRGHVFAFEPLPACRETLGQALAAADPARSAPVELFPYALGNREGTTDYINAVDAPWLSGLHERIYDVPTRKEVLRLEVRKLDSLGLDLRKLVYIKIDCEGGELDVLRGAAQTIAQHRPVISFEFGASSIGAYNITPRDMFDFHAANDYRIFDILGRPLDGDAFVASAEWQQVWDYIAIPAEKSRIAHMLAADYEPMPPTLGERAGALLERLLPGRR